MKMLRWITDHLSDGDKQARALRDLRPMLHEAHGLIVAEDYDKARQILLRAVEFRDGILDAKTIDFMLTLLGSTWLFQERFDEQIAFFSDYIRCYPSDCAAYRERAEAMWYSGRLGDATEDYSRAIELQPTDLQSRSGRGQVLAEMGENEKALRDLGIALRVVDAAPRPNDSWREYKQHTEAFIRNGRALAFGGLGRIQEAMDEFQNSIALSADNAWVYYNRAQVYGRVGDREKALTDFRASLEKKNPPLAPRQREHARAYLEAAEGTV